MSENGNLFLSSLSPESRSWLQTRCLSVLLPLRTALYASERRPAFAYFLTSGMASVVTSMTNGGTVEIGIIGREGAVGSLHLLGPASIPSDCFIQIEATALRIRLADLQFAFDNFDDVHERILEFVQQQALTMGQIAGCNRLHAAEERLARWLLSVQDCIQAEELHITQEFLAQMLGSKRTTVTVIAAGMQAAGLISYSRGRIRILDRPALEAASCECYAVTRGLYRNLFARIVSDRESEEPLVR